MTELHAPPMPPVFVETDGLVLFDITACPLPGVFTPDSAWRGIWNEWVAETAIPGHSGPACYRWGGPDVKWNAGCGVLTYHFFIDEPGVYRLSMRTFSHDAAPGRMRANGAFVRFDGREGGQWHKVKSKVHGEWTWNLMYEHYHDPTEENPSRVPCWHHFDHGFHVMEVSGRQNGMILDRVALARDGVDAHDPALAESPAIALPESEPAW